METPAPKRRGRPPKPRLPTDPSVQADKVPPRRIHRRDTGDFHFSITKDRLQVTAIILDKQGRPCRPDFHRYSGAIRSALREFSWQRDRQQSRFDWAGWLSDGEGDQVREPDARLIQLMAESGLLCTAQLQRVQPVPGRHSLGLLIRPTVTDKLQIIPQIQSLAAEDWDAASEPESSAPRALSPVHVLSGTRLYRCEDLGNAWAEFEGLATVLPRQELPLFLAIALSRFPDLGLDYPPYQLVHTGERRTLPGLVFETVDQHGYLHLRPVAALDGYPAGFFENHDVVKVVELDEAERRLCVAEVVFPVNAYQEFTRLLSGLGKQRRREVYEENGLFILSPNLAANFLAARMAELTRSFVLYQTDTLRSLKIRYARPQLRLSLTTGIDFLQGTASLYLDGERFSYKAFLEEYRKHGCVKLATGDSLYPDEGELRRIERLLRHKASADNPDAVELSFFDLAFLDLRGAVSGPPAMMQRLESFYLGYNDISSLPIGPGLHQGRLRPYQQLGVQWLEHLRMHGLGGCLADEMGLGKTIQVIAVLRKLYAEGEAEPSLIVVPRSLIYNWHEELQRFAPELSILVHYGAKRTVEQIEHSRPQLILSSYATVRQDIEGLLHTSLAYLILDESQNIKNITTKTTVAILHLKARHRLALSGTPIENNLAELYSLFRFINPSFFGSRSSFISTYASPIQDTQDAQALHELRQRIYPYLLRRLKREVLSDLPTKTEQIIRIELSQEHAQVYHQRRAVLQHQIIRTIETEGMAKSVFLILKAFSELRQLASVPEMHGEYYGSSAKRDYLLEMINQLAANRQKCLVFTNYLAGVELVSNDLARGGIEHLTMTGATSNRLELVQRFQSDPGISAFVMTLKTGGVGLNLTAAEYVFVMDPWWNRAAENQAVDRAHRIGQSRPVFCYWLIAKDTIEERILELQERKLALASSLLASDGEAVKQLSLDDIAFLMG